MKVKQKNYILFVSLLIIIHYGNFKLVAQISSEESDSLYDPSLYDPEILCPVYARNKGPTIYIDEGHYNRHTYGGLGGLVAFKNVLIKDGYQINSFNDQFSEASLQNVRLLVISCAQNEKNLEPRWFNPTYSAFEPSEINTLKNWVYHGGSLFLIVDHHPFSGASKELAKEFGIILYNGHAEDTTRYPSFFHRANKTLHSNVITNGRDITEKIDSIVSFNGSAMKLSDVVSPIITFSNDWVQWLPDTAWNFNHVEPESISGYAQGAFMQFGKGKIVIFADANMFSAQDTNWGGKMGFIDPNAKYNYKLLLNIIHYLNGILN
jgi:hypothetical protein